MLLMVTSAYNSDGTFSMYQLIKLFDPAGAELGGEQYLPEISFYSRQFNFSLKNCISTLFLTISLEKNLCPLILLFPSCLALMTLE